LIFDAKDEVPEAFKPNIVKDPISLRKCT
jgi:hypothetical protein